MMDTFLINAVAGNISVELLVQSPHILSDPSLKAGKSPELEHGFYHDSEILLGDTQYQSMTQACITGGLSQCSQKKKKTNYPLISSLHVDKERHN